MSKNKTYSGPLAVYLTSFINEKHFLGFKYEEPERLTHELDELSKGFDCAEGLPKELVMEFVKRKPNWHQSTQEQHVTVVRAVAEYLINHDVPAHMIDRTIVTRLNEDFKPYIFNHREITDIFSVVDSIAPNSVHSHLFYPVLLRVQYGCGLRISETLNMRMKDVNFDENVFHIINAKNNKDRDIPFSESVGEYCKWYKNKIHPVYNKDDYFFQSRWGDGHYEKGAVEHYFKDILFKIGIPHGGRKNGGPHLHCLRHTYCVHSLEQMLRNGIPHQTALPFLCTYMGHSTLSATGRYLKLTAEAFPDLISQIELIYSEMLPDLEVRMSYEEAD